MTNEAREYQGRNSQDFYFTPLMLLTNPKKVTYKSHKVTYKSNKVTYKSHKVTYKSHKVTYKSNKVTYLAKMASAENADTSKVFHGHVAFSLLPMKLKSMV